MCALYDEKEYSDEKHWGKELLGFVERKGDGSWDCFAMEWIGIKPTRKEAMTVVQRTIKNRGEV